MADDGPLHEAADTFEADTLELLDAEREVDIETRSQSGALHQTTIWVVVVEGFPYIRTYTGASARWYREIRAEPHGTLHVQGRRIPIRAVPATDASQIELYSKAMSAKYAGDPAVPAMVSDRVLDTTLRLEPG